jgi:undecaprenyl-diphosphatase
MTLTEAIILGIVQGLTEPLPVSSSAHLVIIPALIPGFHQPSIFFDVVLHVGTLVAVVFFLRKDIAGIVASLPPQKGLGRLLPALTGEERTANRRLVLWIVVATFLTGVIGVLFKDRIEHLFESVETTAVMLFITGILLFLSDRVKRAKREKSSMNLMDGIVIGLVQAVALIPGISRSGSTITFGIFRGLERKTAARFSFLLSIPAIAGAAVLKAAEMTQIPTGDLIALGAGFLSAAGTGFLALKLLFVMINRTGLGLFAYYCWCAGTTTLIIRGMMQ